MNQVHNPYAPPGAVHSAIPLPPERWGEVEVGVESVVRSWTARQLILAGSLPAVIRYESSGAGERVYVNDHLAATTSVFSRPQRPLNAVMDKLDFELPYNEFVVPAQINVYVSIFQLFRITEFSLLVCQRVAYDERRPKSDP